MDYQEEVKQGAKRLSEFLLTKGVRVQHAVALEALAKTFGEANYRTLKAGLEELQTKKAQEEARKNAKPGSKGYHVNAIYTDNNQRYSDTFGGDNALHAQVQAMVDRYADDGLEIEIAAVVDAATGEIADEEGFVSMVGLQDFSEGLVFTLKVASEASSPEQTKLNRYVEYFKKVVDENDFDEKPDYDCDNYKDESLVAYVCEDGAKISFLPHEALEEVARAAADVLKTKEGLSTEERIMVYQTLEYCNMFYFWVDDMLRIDEE